MSKYTPEELDAYLSAVDELAMSVDAEMQGVVDRNFAISLVRSRVAVYVEPEGTTVNVPRGLYSSFADTFLDRGDSPENPLFKWLCAMWRTGKLEPGGRLVFLGGDAAYGGAPRG